VGIGGVLGKYLLHNIRITRIAQLCHHCHWGIREEYTKTRRQTIRCQLLWDVEELKGMRSSCDNSEARIEAKDKSGVPDTFSIN